MLCKILSFLRNLLIRPFFPIVLSSEFERSILSGIACGVTKSYAAKPAYTSRERTIDLCSSQKDPGRV